jgi:hypothetical protein
MPQDRFISEEEWKEDFSNPTMKTKAHGEESMSGSPCSNNMKFFHHCKLSGHWEVKCW